MHMLTAYAQRRVVKLAPATIGWWSGQRESVSHKSSLCQILTTALLCVFFLPALQALPKGKNQERTMRFVLKDSRSRYDEMLGNLKVDSIRTNGLNKLSI